MNLNSNITIFPEQYIHKKSSEEYIHVIFYYPKYESHWDGFVPIQYRRTGININRNNTEKLYEYLNYVYEQLNPTNYESWLKEQERFWNEEKSNANVTKPFFDSLKSGDWKCVSCELPANPNFARRIQDLKEMGYTIATRTHIYCINCGKPTTHLIMLPIKRGNIKGNGYETFPYALRKRIISVLNGIDVFEACKSSNVLPDHKFSEIRWDESTKELNSPNMSEAEIRNKFQLLTNQRNQQKREICRNCYQTGQRGTIFGISYYYEGNDKWDNNIPRKGKEAEKGCVGCPWYDIQRWREELQKELKK